MYVFNSLECIPRDRISGSYGNSRLSFLRDCQTVLQSNCNNLHSYQQCTQGLISSPTLVIVHLFYYTHSGECGGILIYLSLITNDVGYLLIQ